MFPGCLSVLTFVCPLQAAPSKNYAFQQMIMHALQCQHDVDVHLIFSFDIDLHLTCSQVHV